MKKTTRFFKGKGIQRRSFLKLAGLSSLGLSLWPLFAKWGNAGQLSTNKTAATWLTDLKGNKYFLSPKNIRTDSVNNEGIVTAKVDGWWKKYEIGEFADEFHDWWIAEKTWYYDQLIAFFEGDTDELEIPNGGHHHPMLSTYGKVFGRRGDSDFHLNTAVKGLTIIPKEDKIQYVSDKVDEIYEEASAGNLKLPVDLFKFRQELYQEKDIWDKTRFATLELYSGRPINADDEEGGYGFKETKTFQNLMANPMATLAYMSLHSTDGTQSYFDSQSELIPHFQFRGFCWLISYHNPNNTEYEIAIADYINQAHCGYHGGSCEIATNIFLIVEQFNETPDYDPGRGKRVVPSYTYSSRKSNMTVYKPQKKRKLTTEEKMALIRRLRLPV